MDYYQILHHNKLVLTQLVLMYKEAVLAQQIFRPLQNHMSKRSV